jgi:hypothetical protein
MDKLTARKRRSTEALREYNTRRTKTDYYSPRPASPKDEAKGKIEDEMDNLVRLAAKLKLERNEKEKKAKEENRRVEVKIRQRIRVVCCACTSGVPDKRLCCKRCGHEQCAECLLLLQVRKPNH